MMLVGLQTFTSRRDDDTSLEGTHRAPIWEQEFQFLVEDFKSQVRTSQSAALTAGRNLFSCTAMAAASPASQASKAEKGFCQHVKVLDIGRSVSVCIMLSRSWLQAQQCSLDSLQE